MEAGRIPDVSFFFFPARLRKSHSIWIPRPNASDCPKNAPKRMDVAGVMERLPRTISLIARGATPISRAIAFCEIPRGLRYSSSKISPGVIGSFMFIFYNVIGSFSMIIDYRNVFRPRIRPPEDNAPLVIDANGMKTRTPAAKSFKAVAGRHGKVAECDGLIHLNQFSFRS